MLNIFPRSSDNFLGFSRGPGGGSPGKALKLNPQNWLQLFLREISQSILLLLEVLYAHTTLFNK